MIKNQVGLIRCTRIVGLPGDWMNLGAGVGLIAPAGIVGGFNTPGTVYFKDIFNGLNTNDGLTPDTPFQTIAYALTQCTDDNDDYIIVMDAWNEATPILVDCTRVHIIGLSASPERPYPVFTDTGGTPIFQIAAAGNNSEIAYLDLGGGAADASIECLNTSMGVTIHHCTFGFGWAGDTALYGIEINTNATAIYIGYNVFKGSGGSVAGTITADGIRWAGGASSLGGVIENNRFLGLPGIAVNLLTQAIGMSVKDNVIACDADTQGSAITVAGACAGCLITGNKAMFGQTAGGMANNPFLDSTVAGTNHWSSNMKGAAFIDPA